MYSRAERKLVLYECATSDNPKIAPGTYTLDRSLEKKRYKGYAPFLSLTKRVSYFDETVGTAPPAGNYELEMPFRMIKQNCANGAVFGKSKIDRFAIRQAKVPGPGAYDIKSPLEPGKTAKGNPIIPKGLPNPSSLVPELIKLEEEAEEKKIHWERKFIPPSIPYGEFSAGYENGQEGELKPRKLSHASWLEEQKILGFADESKMYEKGTSFGKSSTKKCQIFKVNDVPGPGNYETVERIPLIVMKGRRQSKSKRPVLKPAQPAKQVKILLNPLHYQKLMRFSEAVAAMAEKQNIPGPGTYDASRTSKNKFIPFSITPGRDVAKAIPLGTPFSNEDTPGPCAYFNDEKAKSQEVIGKPKQIKQRKGSSKAKKPFGSSGNRFGSIKSDPKLGPGAYDTLSLASISTEAQKKKLVSGEFGFGSQANRFNYKNSAAELPGPSDYQPRITKDKIPSEEDLAQQLKSQQSSSVFASFSERFKVANLDTPAPGVYEVALSHRLATEKGLWWINSKILASGTSRETFKVSNPEIPGPSHYEPKLPDKSQILVDIYKHADIDNRFRAKATGSPGPGYYGAELKPLMKKTFNVTLDAVKPINQTVI